MTLLFIQNVEQIDLFAQALANQTKITVGLARPVEPSKSSLYAK